MPEIELAPPRRRLRQHHRRSLGVVATLAFAAVAAVSLSQLVGSLRPDVGADTFALPPLARQPRDAGERTASGAAAAGGQSDGGTPSTSDQGSRGGRTAQPTAPVTSGEPSGTSLPSVQPGADAEPAGDLSPDLTPEPSGGDVALPSPELDPGSPTGPGAAAPKRRLLTGLLSPVEQVVLDVLDAAAPVTVKPTRAVLHTTNTLLDSVEGLLPIRLGAGRR
ncbi:hypothetical protein BH09ACT12_BH09ACT12_07070 [soil metagenome]